MLSDKNVIKFTKKLFKMIVKLFNLVLHDPKPFDVLINTFTPYLLTPKQRQFMDTFTKPEQKSKWLEVLALIRELQ